MNTMFNIRAERKVPLAQLHMAEVFVFDDYLVEAPSKEEALEEFYYRVPIIDHTHFDVRISERMA